MWIQRLVSAPPASTRMTLVAGSSLSRAATAQPAEPAPTTMKSASSSSSRTGMAGPPFLVSQDCPAPAAPAIRTAAGGARGYRFIERTRDRRMIGVSLGLQRVMRPDGIPADPEQIIADLRRQLAVLTAERDEALAQQAAVAEVVGII